MKLTRTILTSMLAVSAIIGCSSSVTLKEYPAVSEEALKGYFELAGPSSTANLYIDASDHKVVSTAAGMLADDIQRVTGRKPSVISAGALDEVPAGNAVIAGTVGNSALIDALVAQNVINVDDIIGKWESFIITQAKIPGRSEPALVIAGSDRRGTAYGLTSMCQQIGVSPWYFWADVTPAKKSALYVQPGRFMQKEPSVQYRGIFINDERFGGWAKWVENHYDKETGKVGPKVYTQVFDLLLRLKGNYLWPAMHPGTQAFNADPMNAKLADDYAIVMGSSHCEQMLRNNEGEWKAVNELAISEGRTAPMGDFNYITNRETMINYWETRVKTNGQYENTYTLGLRGIHDYPMEGANTTEERVKLMQQAINDQRDMLRRNIDRPVEEVPQVLCTYEEVLDAYHNGLVVPDDVTMLWSDDKHGYTRNLSNPEEMKRKGGAGIYYHISYHGDPASWIWLSPLSPAFISEELTKAYTFGAQKIWVFNVGDIKPAEKELSFAMELAWDIDKWSPENAYNYIYEWASEVFGVEYAAEISEIQNSYYKLMAAGKDAHVYFVNYPETEIRARIDEYRKIADKAMDLYNRIPQHLQNAYFELIAYPVKGAQMINEYQLLSRLSMAHATYGDAEVALSDAKRVVEMYNALNDWTRHYNEVLLDGKWKYFFSWQPYFWVNSPIMDAPICTPELLEAVAKAPAPRFVSVADALSSDGISITSEVEGDIDIWINALSPIQNFSKKAIDNIFCTVNIDGRAFTASATPINNVWHATHVGPMWSRVGKLHLKKGDNLLKITELKEDARIDGIFLGVYPPFPDAPTMTIAAADYSASHNSDAGTLKTIPQLGFSDGVVVLPYDTPSYDNSTLSSAPYVEYELELKAGENRVEIRTLPTLHVYEGREARYGASVDGDALRVFSIHTEDFSAEWRWNVLRGYSFRDFNVNASADGKHTLRIYLLDPGIVLQEVRVYN